MCIVRYIHCVVLKNSNYYRTLWTSLWENEIIVRRVRLRSFAWSVSASISKYFTRLPSYTVLVCLGDTRVYCWG